jgi:aspartate aminotransferase
VYGRADLAAIAAVLERHPHVMLMTDDIYEHLTYDGIRHVNMAAVAPGLAERTLFVGGFSKSYAMTGWRVGYACGPLDLVRAIGKLIGQSTTCASSISQAAAVAALAGSQDFVEEARAIYQRRRDLMHGIVSSIDGVRVARPQGAFYLFPDVSGLMGRRTPSGETLRSDADLVMYLLEAANVAVIDGGPYGLSPYLRLSYATSMEAIERGCMQMKAACERLQA